MEILNIKNLSFSYPNSNIQALKNIDINISKGDFILLCGQSGSGKSTLLRLLKPQLAPTGSLNGEILFNNKNICELSKRESAEKIGFIMQNPENQIVTDKVYHELAFAMESLGYDKEKIRLKSGEMASFFGLSEVFNKDTNQLSGGQKQLLNLASVLTLQPNILILDEPTSQLDPLSAEKFLNTLKKLNRDFGLTVILSEHNLEEVFDYSTKVLVLDKGVVCSFDTPQNTFENLKKSNINHPMLSALPTPLQVFNNLATSKTDLSPNPLPMNINQGRIFLEKNFNNTINKIDIRIKSIQNNDNNKIKDNNKFNSQIKNKKAPVAISLKNIFFRYEKKSFDVLKDLNLTVNQGEIYAILGANGSGKSTTIKILNSSLKAYHGKIKSIENKSLAYLPQNPQTLFIKDTLLEDFLLVSDKEAIDKMAKIFGIESLLNQHPFDLSGGEIQKAALAKLLLKNPSLLLLDEPTKGIDAFAKKDLAIMLKNLQKQGVTILIVTHDTEFACLVSNRCGLLFDGTIIAEDSTREFFSGNSFYTTNASKMSRGFYENAVTVSDIVTLCKLNGEKNA